MERKIYNQMRHFENSWWYEGRKRVIEKVLKRFLSYKVTALDIGAGWGGMFETMKSFSSTVDAIETDNDAREKLHLRGYRRVFLGVQEIRAHYDLVVAFDVLEHIEDDMAALCQWKSLLHEGGLVVLTVPAHQYLYTDHDKSCHHYRRYGKKDLHDVLVNAGFTPLYITFWNFPSFLPAIFLRALRITGDRNEFLAEGVVSRIVRFLLRMEAMCIPKYSFPIGTSLLIVGQKSTPSQREDS